MPAIASGERRNGFGGSGSTSEGDRFSFFFLLFFLRDG